MLGISTVRLALFISSLEYSVKFVKDLLTFLMKTFPCLISVWMQHEFMSKRSTTMELAPDWMMKIFSFEFDNVVSNYCNILLPSF